MVFDFIALGLGDFFLPRLDLVVKKLLDPAAVHTNNVVVVFAFIQLKNRFSVLKIAATQNARLLKLRQHAVHRRQANGGVVAHQQFVNIFRAHVALRGVLEQRQNGLARPGHLEAGVFEFV